MGVMMAIGFGIKYEIFPPLIFMGVGAMTDFGPLIANPKTMLLGAAAQIGGIRCIGRRYAPRIQCAGSGIHRHHRRC